jgi:hypothetical protein
MVSSSGASVRRGGVGHQLLDQFFDIGKNGVEAGRGHGLGGQLACRDGGVGIGGQPGAAVVRCRRGQDAAAGQSAIHRWRAAGAVQHRPRRHGVLDVAEVAAVQPDPAAGIAGELGGQPGRLLSSSVGDHRDRRIRHGIIPSRRGTVAACIGTEVKVGSWLRQGPCSPAKPANQRTQPARQQPTAASCEAARASDRLRLEEPIATVWSLLVACMSRDGRTAVGRGTRSVVADPDTDSPDPLRRAEQARAHSQALQKEVVEAAEAVAEVEQEAARVHQILADQGGPLAEQAREHADRAEDLAAKERAEAQRLREADRD